MTDEDRTVTHGADTHTDTHVAAVIDAVGRRRPGRSRRPCRVPPAARLDGFVRGTGPGWGGGAGAYGAGLARFLADQAVVVQANRPSRQTRRRRGKNDTVDAEAAARAVRNGEANGVGAGIENAGS